MEEGVEYVDGSGAVYLRCVGVGRMSVGVSTLLGDVRSFWTIGLWHV
jgi:hypothetical protein